MSLGLGAAGALAAGAVVAAASALVSSIQTDEHYSTPDGSKTPVSVADSSDVRTMDGYEGGAPLEERPLRWASMTDEDHHVSEVSSAYKTEAPGSVMLAIEKHENQDIVSSRYPTQTKQRSLLTFPSPRAARPTRMQRPRSQRRRPSLTRSRRTLLRQRPSRCAPSPPSSWLASSGLEVDGYLSRKIEGEDQRTPVAGPHAILPDVEDTHVARPLEVSLTCSMPGVERC